MSATVRFSQLVAASGKPQLHTLWGPPEKDADFQRALKSHRVLTVHQENIGSKKDYGLVGFSKDGPAQFLVFPRTIKSFEGQRVVGINYDVFEPPPAAKKSSNSRPNSSSRDRTSAGNKRARLTLPRTETSPIVVAPDKLARAEKPVDLEPRISAKTVVQKDDVPAARDDGAEETTATRPSRTSLTEARVENVHHEATLDRRAILKALRAALKELEAGKAVVVFRRLEKLVEALSEHE